MCVCRGHKRGEVVHTEGVDVTDRNVITIKKLKGQRENERGMKVFSRLNLKRGKMIF